MSLTAEVKKSIVEKYGQNLGDTGSTVVQVALLTERLNMLNGHFDKNPKDHHSRRGLLKLVGQRRKLLNYLNASNPAAYKKAISDLGIRR